MTTKLDKEFEREDSDAQLEQLLAQARWPEPDSDSILRLQRFVTATLAASPCAAEPLERQVKVQGSRSRFRAVLIAASLVAALGTAFLAGRWTSPRAVHTVATSGDPGVSSESAAVQSKAADPQSPRTESVAASDNAVNQKIPDSQDSKYAATSQQTDTIEPKPDPVLEKRRHLTQRQRMTAQLESVLACLENSGQEEVSCCQTLMPRRAEFEYLLGEIIRTTTGQRQLSAVTAMGFVGTDGAVPMLLQSTADVSLRSAAVGAVRRCSSEQMLAGLVMTPGDESLRREFLTELTHRTTPQAAAVWLHLVRTAEAGSLCLQNVDELSPVLIERLFGELSAPLMDDRMAAIVTLGRRSDEKTLQRVIQLCEQFPDRWEPVAILMWNGSQPAMRTLAALENAQHYAVLQTASVQLKSFVTENGN